MDAPTKRGGLFGRRRGKTDSRQDSPAGVGGGDQWGSDGVIPGLASAKLFGGTCRGIVPLLSECRAFLLHGDRLNHEGIFRVPGNSSTVDALQAMYEEGCDGILVDLGDGLGAAESGLTPSVNDVTTLFKKYFRELKTSLIPMTLYNDLLEAQEACDDATRGTAANPVVQVRRQYKRHGHTANPTTLWGHDTPPVRHTAPP